MKHYSDSILKRTGVILLSSALIVTGSFALGGRDGNDPYEVAAETQKSIEASFPKITKNSSKSDKLSKDETVYVIMDADGNKEETLVSEWLRNPEKLKTIDDSSSLTDIKNTNGEETFEQDGEKITWNASGKDIKYSGKTDESLPVSLEVTYYLDGEEVSTEEIAGKSGDVEIHFNYFVNTQDRVKANGKAYDVEHPYIMASGLVLDSDHFDDITVSNGRTMDENGSTVCLGIAFPGMQESLDVDRDMIEIPDSVVVKAKTDKFKIDGTYTVALTGLMDDLDVSSDDITSDIDKLGDAFDQLSDASSELVKGSKKLKDGTEALSDGASILAGGTSKLSKGAKKLNKGSKALAGGTSQLKEKSGALGEGIDQLAQGAESLAKGTTQVKEGAAGAAQGAKSLSEGLSQLSGNSEALNQGTKQLEDSVFESSTSGLQAMLIQGGMPKEQAESFKLTPSTYEGVISKLKQAVPDSASSLDQLKASLDSVETYVASVKTYTDGVDSVSAGAEDLYAGLESLSKGADLADKGALGIKGGLSELSGSVPALKQGVDALDKGASQVNSGADALDKGASKVDKGASKLDGGAAKLDQGMGELTKGIKKFDKEGIQKLVDSLDPDEISDVVGRFEAVLKASKKQHFIGGTPSSIAGESKIIFKTGSVE